MSIFEAVILGLVQGLTEFLPVSSSGHLVLVRLIVGVKGDVVLFDLALHCATLIAVCAVLRKDIWEIIKKPFGRLPMLVLTATIPAVIAGVLFNDFFESLLETGALLGICFVILSIILWYADMIAPAGGRGKTSPEQAAYTDAGMVGVAQMAALFPALSRSGLTMAGGLLRGFNREFAIRFSFLMSIPTIAGAAVFKLADVIQGGVSFDSGGIPVAQLIIGMMVAGISGYLAVKYMLKVFAKTKLVYFSFYVLALGLLILADQYLFHIVFK